MLSTSSWSLQHLFKFLLPQRLIGKYESIKIIALLIHILLLTFVAIKI